MKLTSLYREIKKIIHQGFTNKFGCLEVGIGHGHRIEHGHGIEHRCRIERGGGN